MQNNNSDELSSEHFIKECTLIRESIGSGITALGKAGYGDNLGNYYNAFFGLSTGIERLAKLILVVDDINKSDDNLPNKNKNKSYGHNLIKLFDAVETVTLNHKTELKHRCPHNAISNAIISCLTSFANAGKGRYANFNALDNSNSENEHEPIQKWWCKVANPILKEHYFDTDLEKELQQHIVQYLESPDKLYPVMLERDEFGETMHTVQDYWTRDAQTKLVQKFGRYHTLIIVRWMAEVFLIITRDGDWGISNSTRCDIMFANYPTFLDFLEPDEVLLTKKQWP